MYYGEKLNSISHLVGAALALVGLGALLTISIQTKNPWVITSFSVFGLSMVLLYTMSTLYHSFSPPRIKRLFQILDHVSIYLLIAGTYTPYMLVSLRDGKGWAIMSIIWGLAIVGIVSEVLLSGRVVKIGQMIIYLMMGFACTYDLEALRNALSDNGFYWLTLGGIAYATGVIFYILDKMQRLYHAHGIWHFFVLAGTICHFISIVGYVR